MKTVHYRPELSVGEREAELKKLCTSATEETFFRSLTESDIEKEKHLYAEKGGELKEKKAEAKASAATFNAIIQAIEKDMDERLERIQTGKKKVYDNLYGVPNFNTGTMEFFDRFGELISSRKLTPDECTGRLFNNAGEQAHTEQSLLLEADLADGMDVQDAEYEEIAEQAGEAETETDNTSGEDNEKPKKPRKNARNKKVG